VRVQFVEGCRRGQCVRGWGGTEAGCQHRPTVPVSVGVIGGRGALLGVWNCISAWRGVWAEESGGSLGEVLFGFGCIVDR